MDSLIEQLDQARYQNYLQMAGGAAVLYSYVFYWSRSAFWLIMFTYQALYFGSFSVYVTLALYWTQLIFIFAMEVILLLRVYALYNRSKKILAVLLACFFCQAIASIVLQAMQYNSSFIGKYITSVGPSLGSFSEEGDVNPAFVPTTPKVFLPILLVFDVILFAFAIVAFVKHALQSKASHGSWAINSLIKLSITDHTLYFLCYTVWQAVSLADSIVGILISTWMATIKFVLLSLVVIFGPSMVLILRARDRDAKRIPFERFNMVRLDVQETIGLHGGRKSTSSEVCDEETG
ncbi:hypothetical protein BJ138DRAFT_1103396 [Hygrophoropsis aurantiaca]|uniref:Uncharacterized protein n=1 Tax=Hygrophoropsis aurantiaca TaxID=72124 RepID=A0ACB8A648_9AGAM|nr:hypothetical protein BJ138DRAFT_1103396 [Hygrophoropsis aurantiaca]